ncbi:hypothetical protein L7F22_058181 [Adiantum nelumboides]|nr:hypothetical protein [Adiantum nelumboides]
MAEYSDSQMTTPSSKMVGESSPQARSSVRKTRFQGRMATPSDSDDEVQVVTPLKVMSHTVQDRNAAYIFIDFRVGSYSFCLPTADDNEVGKATEKEMAKAFGSAQGDRHYYQFSGMKDQGKLQQLLRWFIERMFLLVKSEYVSRENYGIFLAAEHGRTLFGCNIPICEQQNNPGNKKQGSFKRGSFRSRTFTRKQRSQTKNLQDNLSSQMENDVQTIQDSGYTKKQTDIDWEHLDFVFGDLIPDPVQQNNQPILFHSARTGFKLKKRKTIIQEEFEAGNVVQKLDFSNVSFVRAQNALSLIKEFVEQQSLDVTCLSRENEGLQNQLKQVKGEMLSEQQKQLGKEQLQEQKTSERVKEWKEDWLKVLNEQFENMANKNTALETVDEQRDVEQMKGELREFMKEIWNQVKVKMYEMVREDVAEKVDDTEEEIIAEEDGKIEAVISNKEKVDSHNVL